MKDARITLRQLRTKTEHIGRTTYGIHQPFGTDVPNTRTKGQGNTTKSFISIHGIQI